MGALPAARGTGAAPALLDDFIARARAEGLPHVELECFAENERALRLYRGRGFPGDRRAPMAGSGTEGAAARADAGAAAPATCAAVDARARARVAGRRQPAHRVAAVPQWRPLHGRRQVRPLTFWRCGNAQIAFSVLEGTPTHIHSLIDLDPALRDAEVLAHAVAAAHPDAFAPPILRDDFGGEALRRAGFVRRMA